MGDKGGCECAVCSGPTEMFVLSDKARGVVFRAAEGVEWSAAAAARSAGAFARFKRLSLFRAGSGWASGTVSKVISSSSMVLETDSLGLDSFEQDKYQITAGRSMHTRGARLPSGLNK